MCNWAFGKNWVSSSIAGLVDFEAHLCAVFSVWLEAGLEFCAWFICQLRRNCTYICSFAHFLNDFVSGQEGKNLLSAWQGQFLARNTEWLFLKSQAVEEKNIVYGKKQKLLGHFNSQFKSTMIP